MAMRTAYIEMTVMNKNIKVEIPVPEGFVKPSTLMPLFQGLSDTIVKIAIEKDNREGKNLTCKKGCGACCHQIVPIGKVEMYWLRDVVSGLPKQKQEQLKKRFADIEHNLKKSGLFQDSLDIAKLKPEERHTLGKSYFNLGIPCPFLENEICIIHEKRPIICREYAVSSPAINCLAPTANTIEKMSIPSLISHIVSKLGCEDEKVSLIPLALIFCSDFAEEVQQPIQATIAIEKAFSPKENSKIN